MFLLAWHCKAIGMFVCLTTPNKGFSVDTYADCQLFHILCTLHALYFPLQACSGINCDSLWQFKQEDTAPESTAITQGDTAFVVS